MSITRNYTMSIRLNQVEHSTLDALSRQYGLSPAYFIRFLLAREMRVLTDEQQSRLFRARPSWFDALLQADEEEEEA